MKRKLNRKSRTKQKATSDKPLDKREKIFVGEYLNTLKPYDSAKIAGYSESVCKSLAYTWPTDPKAKPHVYKAIEDAMKKREHRTEVTQDKVLLELAKIGFSNVKDLYDEHGELIPIHLLPDDVAATISSIEVEEIFAGRGEDREVIGQIKRIKRWNKNDALNTIAKHLGMLKEKMELTGANGNPLVPNNVELVVNFIANKTKEALNYKDEPILIEGGEVKK